MGLLVKIAFAFAFALVLIIGSKSESESKPLYPKDHERYKPVKWEAVQGYVTSYTCAVDARNPMSGCTTTKWGADARDPSINGSACPKDMGGATIKIEGEIFVCDDTPRDDEVYGRKHFDRRRFSYQLALEEGENFVTVYVKVE